MKHIHHAEIKAWADGAKIQTRTAYYRQWETVTDPVWALHQEYRVEPPPLRTFYMYQYPSGGWAVFTTREQYDNLPLARGEPVIAYEGAVHSDVEAGITQEGS